MTTKKDWQPVALDSVERRLVEARNLLFQAAALLEASDMEQLAKLTDLHLDEEGTRNDHPHGRRYR